MITLKEYRVWLKTSDPSFKTQLPAPILRAITQRAIENGHSVELEIATRLARSLEQEDNENNDEDL